MQKICVFIDFTDGCKIALKQASVLAQKNNATICLLHIVDAADEIEKTKVHLLKFAKSTLGHSVLMEAYAGLGNLMDGAPAQLRKINPDLVIIGTHGIKGIKQKFLGADILKLVKVIEYPCIVVQENTTVKETGFAKILFPVGPHHDFLVKIKQTAKFAKTFDCLVVIYEIAKEGFDLGGMVGKNSNLAKAHFVENNVSYISVTEEMTVFSAGNSRQTLNYADKNSFDLISMMATISQNEILFGSTDKENLLVNSFGIPILCCNE
ncbi:MAG TPA: universal stress protein [Bacteroidia bacterium]|nr:universal stress protein [Bacteroidia bacterium]